MRELADAPRIRRFMQALADSAEAPVRVYFTGGATAVLIGWRQSTIDVDLTLVPESDALLRAIPAIKETLRINVELASPAHFIPVAPGWEERRMSRIRAGAGDACHVGAVLQAVGERLEHQQVLGRADAQCDARLELDVGGACDHVGLEGQAA